MGGGGEAQVAVGKDGRRSGGTCGGGKVLGGGGEVL